jgi:hypothetical protein
MESKRDGLQSRQSMRMQAQGEVMSNTHEALPQLSGASLLDIKSLAAQAENAAITARSRTDTLIQAYLDLQKQNVKQHALIVQMAEALKHARTVFNHHDLLSGIAPVNNAILAAKDYLK